MPLTVKRTRIVSRHMNGMLLGNGTMRRVAALPAAPRGGPLVPKFVRAGLGAGGGRGGGARAASSLSAFSASSISLISAIVLSLHAVSSTSSVTLSISGGSSTISYSFVSSSANSFARLFASVRIDSRSARRRFSPPVSSGRPFSQASSKLLTNRSSSRGRSCKPRVFALNFICAFAVITTSKRKLLFQFKWLTFCCASEL
mmetsp:Transcript_17336/g.34703  ORF Transcript_17336/g.34703 Transcript_17336/m.34703 type:complete len:201 (-) Transcript_17336:11-613(-)